MTKIASKDVTVKPLNDIEQLQALVERMSEEDRGKLAQAGVQVPQGDLTAMSEGRHAWGIRCTDCNKIALYFVGSKWTWLGQEMDTPPQLPHNQIAWMQNLPPSQINRNQPRCQHCGIPVRLNPDDSFNRERQRLVSLAGWEDSRDKRFSTASARTNDRTASKGSAEVQLGDSQNFNAANRPTSDVIAEQTGNPNIKAELEAAAEVTGFKAAVQSGKL